MAYERLAGAEELRSGEMAGYRVGGRKVLVVRVAGRLYAYQDRCAHLGLPLSEGSLEGAVLTCRAHHFQYDACSGQGINPRRACLTGYPLKIESGAVYVELASEGVS